MASLRTTLALLLLAHFGNVSTICTDIWIADSLRVKDNFGFEGIAKYTILYEVKQLIA
jgi:hypothetical protein